MKVSIGKGTSAIYDGTFLAWEVLDEDGNVLFKVFGSMSLMAAMAALKAFKSGFTMEEAIDIYSANRPENLEDDIS